MSALPAVVRSFCCTGGRTFHTFAEVSPLLAADYRVIVPYLRGHRLPIGRRTPTYRLSLGPHRCTFAQRTGAHMPPELEPWGGEVRLPAWLRRVLRRPVNTDNTPERTPHEIRQRTRVSRCCST
jgi:hypothetical protein